MYFFLQNLDENDVEMFGIIVGQKCFAESAL